MKNEVRKQLVSDADILISDSKPKNIGRGRKLAMKRIKAAAAEKCNELLANNRFVPAGGECIAPEAATGVVVRFG